MFGWTCEEVVGKSLSVIIPNRNRERAVQKIAIYHETNLQFAKIAHPEMFGVHRDGTEFPVSISVYAMLIDGNRHLVGFIRTTSEEIAFVNELRAVGSRLTEVLSD